MKFMQKLIKLSDSHYIVVDDSEIKDKEPFIDMRDYPDVYDEDIYWAGSGGDAEFANTIGKKITHSFGEELKGVNNKSLSEVEEAIYGYSVEKMILERYPKCNSLLQGIWTNGFKAHQELTKDKLFTIGDVKKIIHWASLDEDVRLSEEEMFKSLLPKIEWDIEFDEQGKIKLI